MNSRAKKTVSAEAALAKLEVLCATSEHCTFEIKQKLYKWGLNEADSRKIIETLRGNRYIDDRRFSEAYVDEKIMFSYWGKLKVRAALSLKQIDKTIIDEALSAVDEDRYFDNLSRLIANKARTITDADTYEGRTKLFRHAASRGFETGLISKAIKQMAKK